MTVIKKKETLNPKQEQFCQLYSLSESFFGNGTQAYIEVYSTKIKKVDYKTAMASASRLLSNVKILERINELLELRGLNDPFVDKQLEFLITQNSDFKTKLGGIKEYNALKKRISKGFEFDPENTRIIGIIINTPDAKKATDLSKS